MGYTIIYEGNLEVMDLPNSPRGMIRLKMVGGEEIIAPSRILIKGTEEVINKLKIGAKLLLIAP